MFRPYIFLHLQLLSAFVSSREQLNQFLALEQPSLVDDSKSLMSSPGQDLGDLVLVTVLFRHGDRTPVQPYPNDPYKNNSLWPAQWGELTDIGKRQHYELGKWLRKKYSTLLSLKYSPDDIYIQSTNVDRTLMSAYSNLAGLYEPDLKNNWSPNIKWQPIPVHTIPQSLDMVLAAKKPCPKYEKYLDSLLTSKEFRAIDEANKELYKYLNKHSGLSISRFKQIGDLHDTLFIESLYNFTLPAWTAQVYPQPLKKWADFGFTIPCYNKEMARLKVGPLIADIAMHMKKKISGNLKPDRKVWMYSAHDLTVANVLQALEVFDPQCPPYTSLILFELRKKGEDFYVALYYRNSSAEPPFFIQIPGCEKLCPFKKFSELISPLIPVDWEKECQYSLYSENIYSSINGGNFLLSVSMIASFLTFFTLGFLCYKKQCFSIGDSPYQSLKMEIHS